MMMTKQKASLAERLNVGNEVRELKLGATFNPRNTSTAFHTIKYDFKPASVDTGRMATVDVGSNNQVTVTVPNLESSGVPHTVYKGNHRKYTKECLIIFDKETGAMTLEKLNHNIQVKKTRSEMTNKPSLPPAVNAPNNIVNVPPATSSGSAPRLENSTVRITSKTKVSTGSRRNNIIDFKPRNSPMQQSSPSRPVATHRSPQSAPAWHANNNQQTLPSIPMITDDDDYGLGAALQSGGNANTSGSSTHSSSGGGGGGGQIDGPGPSHIGKQRQSQYSGHGKRQHKQPLQQQQNYGRSYNGGGNDVPQPQSQANYSQQHHQLQHQQQQQQQRYSPQPQQYQQTHPSMNNQGNASLGFDSPNQMESVAHAAAVLEQQIGGALSASSSSSESDSSDSDSGSDSDDSSDGERPMQQQQQQQHQQHQHHHQKQSLQQQQMHQLPNLGLGSTSPTYDVHHHQRRQQQQQQQQHHHQTNIYATNNDFPSDLLQNDLQLSSNSSDEDDD